ncbi:TolB-like 6-bladed beta-propeller domain-containing protein [Aquiflexum sp. TKW24L]|uniref:BF3164 family lipoprotein n=1 Tax=Aquiflexum sp. TKW24L TaxID=2942212 RepID=UPI0020C0E1F2|nr:BF3164 family lipoprotein [Aquiflexum sp. TKW24L]MCL6260686.1 TolB-like 6-bladed beta-propeller domain-containing protein [Aquiflexum sp. TKW24L]
MKINIKILVFSILAFSCTTPSEKSIYKDAIIQFSDKNLKSELTLKGEIIKNISDSLIRPTTLLLIDQDILAITDIQSKNVFHLVGLPNYKYLGNFGKKGFGPGEIEVPWKLFQSGIGIFGIYDAEQKKTVEFSIDSILINNSYLNEIKLGSDVNSNSVAIKNKKLFFTNSNNNNYSLFSKDLDTENKKSYGKFPDFQNYYPQIPKAELGEIIGFTKLINYDDIFALSYYNVPLIEIFNYKSNDWISISGPDPLPVLPLLGKNIYYGSICITERFIYALYYGRDDTFENPSKTIYVFSHNGTFEKKIILETGIFDLTVLNDQLIFGLTRNIEEFEYALLKFSLI